DRNVILRLRTIEIPRRVSFIQHVASYQKQVGPIVPSRPELTASADSLSFATVTVGDTVSLDLRIENTGNQALTITSVTLPSAEMEINRLLPITITPDSTDTLTVFLQPRTELNISGNLLVSSDDPITPVASIAVTTDIKPLSIASQALPDSTTVPLGAGVTVLVIPAEAVRIERGTLYHGATGDTVFSAVPLKLSGGFFSGIIPGEAVTELGLQYYVEVENSGVFNTDPPGAPTDSLFFQAVESPMSITSAAQPNSGDGFVENRIVRVLVTLPLGAIFKRGALHFRRGGEEFFQVDSLRTGDPLAFGTIPDSLVGPRGVEYWVSVETESQTMLTDPPIDAAGNPRSLSIVVSDLVEKNKHAGEVFRLLSVPLAMQGTITGALTDDIGGPDNMRWRLFAFEPVGGKNYLELPNDSLFAFEQGRAYWLITRDGHRIGTGPDLGETTPTDGMYALTLQPGFNLIGNPFNFPVAWDSMRVDTLSMAQAVSKLVEPPVRWGGFQYRGDVTVLDPFEGYWVKNLHTAAVVLRIPPEEAAGGATRTFPATVASAAIATTTGTDGWRLQLSARSGDARDTYNYVGVTPGATLHRDPSDRSEAPMSPGPAISLYFPHNDWEKHPGPYTVDMRGEAQAVDTKTLGLSLTEQELWGYVWRFDVAKNFSVDGAGDEVVLDFGDIESVPGDAKVLLVDHDLDRLTDLKKEHTYRYFQGVRAVVQSENDARFALIVGSDEFIAKRDDLPALPTRTVLHQNYPNPFNPTTIIRYEIARPGDVTLRMYNAAGALVKELYNGHRAAGVYEAGWNGENNQGRKVASGIYFYKLTAVDFAQTKKMILLK
ncbi:MAG: FlgD immunoglobulin-like domain containing protein, partial [Candidatus Krumholzibacteria bacterium]